MALFSTEHAPWRKERMDADRIKSNKEQLDETETEGKTVAKKTLAV